MKLIVGLGNPGEQYKNNRHNVGYLFIDYLTHYPELKTHNKIILAKPTTFMNRSGHSIQQLIENFKLKIENLYIVHDDLDIPLGKWKLQKGVGPKLHNGLLSIEERLDTKDFWRIRIGVENRSPEQPISGEAYVLQDFTQEERTTVDSLFPAIAQRLFSQSLLTTKH